MESDNSRWWSRWQLLVMTDGWWWWLRWWSFVMMRMMMMITDDDDYDYDYDDDEYDWTVELEEMIRTYSHLNNFQYDAVIALRPDTAMLRDIDLPKVAVVVDAGCAYCATLLVITLTHNPLPPQSQPTPLSLIPTLTPTHSHSYPLSHSHSYPLTLSTWMRSELTPRPFGYLHFSTGGIERSRR